MILSQAKDPFGKINSPVPSLGGDTFITDILTFGIRIFFAIAGIAALIYLLWGAFDWIISGGDKERLSKAQAKIRNAIIGVLMIVAVLAIVTTLERAVFNCKICFGISCPLEIPTIDKPAQNKSCS